MEKGKNLLTSFFFFLLLLLLFFFFSKTFLIRVYYITAYGLILCQTNRIFTTLEIKVKKHRADRNGRKKKKQHFSECLLFSQPLTNTVFKVFDTENRFSFFFNRVLSHNNPCSTFGSPRSILRIKPRMYAYGLLPEAATTTSIAT